MGSLSHEDPADIVQQDQALHELQQVLAGVDVRVGQPQAWLCACVIGWSVQAPATTASGKGQSQLAPLHPCHQGQFSLAYGEGQGPTIPGPVKGRSAQHGPLMSSRMVPVFP